MKIQFEDFNLERVKTDKADNSTTFEAKWTEQAIDKEFGLLPNKVTKDGWHCLNKKVAEIFAELIPFAKALGDHEDAKGLVVTSIQIFREEGEILDVRMKYEHNGVAKKAAKCDTGQCSVLRLLDDEEQASLRSLVADLEMNMYEFFHKELIFRKPVLEVQIG